MKTLKALGLTALVLGAGACQDLAVENVNQPDADRAIGEPRAVESLVGGSFFRYWSDTNKYRPAMTWSTIGDEGSSSWGNFAMQDLSSEPRTAFQNTQSYGYRSFAEVPWYGMYKVLSSANDGLQQINDKGLKILSEDGKTDDTPRAKAFAKFTQGLALGFLGLMFDQAFIYTEDIDLNTDVLELEPYTNVLAAAQQSLTDAAALSAGASFTTPESWINGLPLTGDELSRISHSMIARLMTAGARSPQERDAVNWNEVISHIDKGIQKDYFVQGDGGVWWGFWYLASHPVWMRADYKLIGPADKSGAYAAWLAKAPADRLPFTLVSDDRRVQSATGGNGTYIRNWGAPRHRPDRGTYHFSFYGVSRYLEHFTSGAASPMPWMLMSEMDLLKAEALIRTNKPAAAVALINKYRVGNGKLPALTGTESKEDLMQYMKYEKRLETVYQTAGLAAFDLRGWRTLPGPGITGTPVPIVPGTLLHAPIPAKELEVLRQEIYTLGGVGAKGGALVAPLGSDRFKANVFEQ